jgi:hypothetical protein
MPFGVALRPLIAALALALAIPLSPVQAETDCGSLDIAIDSSAELPDVKCDSGSFMHGGPSQAEEVLVASGAQAVFVIHHVAAGVRTYFERQDTRALIDSGAAFVKIEDWTSAPGGNQFIVARFKGRLSGQPDLALSCFGFSRFSGHVAGTTGFRHIVYGFYCAAQAEQVSDADVHRLIDAVKFGFE